MLDVRAALPCLQVRVGVSIHHSVQSVALDTLVEHRLGGDASKVRLWGVVGGWVRCGVSAGWLEGGCAGCCCWHRGACEEGSNSGCLTCHPAQNVARWERDRLRMQILEEANIGAASVLPLCLLLSLCCCLCMPCVVGAAPQMLSCRHPWCAHSIYNPTPLPPPQSAPRCRSAAAAPSRA